MVMEWSGEYKSTVDQSSLSCASHSVPGNRLQLLLAIPRSGASNYPNSKFSHQSRQNEERKTKSRVDTRDLNPQGSL